MRWGLVLSLALGCAFAPLQARSATFSLTLLYQGAVTGNGDFSFSDSLLGQTVVASQVTSFHLKTNAVNGDQLFSTLGDAAHPDPIASGTPLPFPYFDFNSATDLFVPFVVSPTQYVVLRGGSQLNAEQFDAFTLESDASNGSTYPNGLIYVEHALAHGSNFGYGSFDQIVVSAVPEPSSAGLLGGGMGFVAVAMFYRRRGRA